MKTLPPRQDKPDNHDYRVFVYVPASVRLKLVEQATSRGIDWSRLGGAVLGMWVDAGCPDAIAGEQCPDSSGAAQ